MLIELNLLPQAKSKVVPVVVQKNAASMRMAPRVCVPSGDLEAQHGKNSVYYRTR